MGAFSNIDIDLQELVATMETVGADYDLNNPDSASGAEGRAILFSRLDSLGWVTPTEKRQQVTL